MKITPATIRQQLSELGLLTPDLQVTDTESLMDAAVLDSLHLTDLVTQLERAFGIRVELEDLVPDNFDTVMDIVRFVSMKLGDAAPASVSSAGE